MTVEADETTSSQDDSSSNNNAAQGKHDANVAATTTTTTPTDAEALTLAQCARYVIFLDVDGVLLPVPRYTFGGGELSEACVARLRGIVDVLGGPDAVTMVLSSTWRNSAESIARLNALFARVAGDALPAIADGTPHEAPQLPSDAAYVVYYADDAVEQRLVRDRAAELTHWMHTHIRDHPEAIGGRWLAIDDMQLDVDARVAGHLLHTQTDVGLVDDDVARAREAAARLPSPAQALARARHALCDPALHARAQALLQQELAQLRATLAQRDDALAAAHATLSRMTREHAAQTQQLRQQTRLLEEQRYRLDVAEFAKRHEVLQRALAAAARTSGAERRDVDERIRRLVQLLRTRKTLEKQLRALRIAADKQNKGSNTTKDSSAAADDEAAGVTG